MPRGGSLGFDVQEMGTRSILSCPRRTPHPTLLLLWDPAEILPTSFKDLREAP